MPLSNLFVVQVPKLRVLKNVLSVYYRRICFSLSTVLNTGTSKSSKNALPVYRHLICL